MSPEPVPPLNVTERLRALGMIPPDLFDPEGAPTATYPDYETEARASADVEHMGRKLRGRLKFLRWLYATHPEAVR